MPRYEIKDLPGRLQDRGTANLPVLHHISPGQRNGQSLVFHIQIGRKFHQMVIKDVRKGHVDFKCKSKTGCKGKKCQYHCKMRVSKRFIKKIE